MPTKPNDDDWIESAEHFEQAQKIPNFVRRKRSEFASATPASRTLPGGRPAIEALLTRLRANKPNQQAQQTNAWEDLEPSDTHDQYVHLNDGPVVGHLSDIGVTTDEWNRLPKVAREEVATVLRGLPSIDSAILTLVSEDSHRRRLAKAFISKMAEILRQPKKTARGQTAFPQLANRELALDSARELRKHLRREIFEAKDCVDEIRTPTDANFGEIATLFTGLLEPLIRRFPALATKITPARMRQLRQSRAGDVLDGIVLELFDVSRDQIRLTKTRERTKTPKRGGIRHQ